MEKEEILERLVENGIDFLNRAIEDLQEYPKYSVIHFHTAVELFLKARLMHEHWSLVISQRQSPDWNKFVSGNFQSVTLDMAADRLDKVVRSGLSKPELKSFSERTKHRNKVVHFFHEAHTSNENEEQVRDIVKQQLTAWYFLHHIITTRWNEVFKPWNSSFIKLNEKLRYLHTFLQVVFDQIKPEIDKRKAAGELFQSCPSCGFESQHHEPDMKTVYETKCLVCGLSENALRINCPSCENEVIFINEGFGSCDNCDKEFEPDDLANELIDEGAAYIAHKDADSSWDLGNCSDCDGYHTVVRMEDDSYLCASCFNSFDTLHWCGWCNDPNTANMEQSSWAGCNHCDGRAAWD